MMFNILPVHLLVFSSSIVATFGLPDLGIRDTGTWALKFPRRLWSPFSINIETRSSSALGTGINFNPNGSAFLWLPQDDYSGSTFFDGFDFFTGPDPTDGLVTFVNESYAISQGFVYVDNSTNTVIMKADDTTSLQMGINRYSVRITSKAVYNTGLFVLDLNRAPWGCAIWPAFWTVGDEWPRNGEVDILEGVHDNQYNQIAFHTNPGCYLDPNATYTGTIPTDNGQNRTNCDANANSNSGCNVVEWSRASYGPYFEAQGGGVLAMKWDENDISVWSFYRAAIPADIAAGSPNPSLWGAPSAILKNTMCNIPRFFANHSIVFDITFCGQWAGNSYATSGCPGTCPEQLMNPANFVNATWSINSLKVFRKQLIALNASQLSGAQVRDVKKGSVVLSLLVCFIINLWW